MNRSHDNLPPEFEGIGRLLEQERAQLSAIELDSVKRRVMSRASAGTPSPTKGNFMKSRLAILATLVVGLLMSGTGATLAIDGLQSAQDPAAAQYGQPAPPTGQVLGQNPTGTGGIIPPPTAPKPKSGGPKRPAAVTVPSGGEVRADVAQPTRQVEVGGPTIARLPFTGYAGITVLLLGLMLLGTGLLLRARTREQ